ncbi:MAG: C40 family peptidase [Pseudonocardiales bacterium]|nr:C40 family peptidase [Pseudonocardiales bacterium]
MSSGEETRAVALRLHLRAAFGLLASILFAMVTLTVVGAPVYADPEPPPSASDAAKQLAAAQREAEDLTEQWHQAQDTMDVKQNEAQRAQAAVEPARRGVQRAKANEEQFRVEVDPVVTEAYQAGRLDQLNVLITSDSPSDFLDQMTALDSFTADRLAVLNHMVELVSVSTKAQAEADGAAARATQAAAEAKASFTEIGVRRKQAEVHIDEAEKLLARLSPAEKAQRTRDEGDPLGVVLGGGKGALALKIAMTRMRMPYVWGATGDTTFDCSGLMYWAFKKVGITLPRSAAAQSAVGRPVSRSDLQPGDMVFFYNPVQHVGFYAGNGKVLNAVQTGDVVRYSDLSRMYFHSARRL